MGAGRQAASKWLALALAAVTGAPARATCAELPPDERKGTCTAFMSRCLGFFEGMGVGVERVMTDDGPGYRGGKPDDLLGSKGVRHLYTRPLSPWQNGKAERVSRTIAQGWRYGRAWDSEAGRAGAPRPSSGATIGSVRTARAGASRRCPASSA